MGRPRLIMTNKKNNILTRHLSSICGLSTASSKKDLASLDFIFHSAKNTAQSGSHYYHQNSFNKKINGINIESFLEETKEYQKQKSNNINQNVKLHKSRTVLGQINDLSNRQNNFDLKTEKEKNNKNKPFFRRLYSHEFIEFENEMTKKNHFVKKYKEDDITFTKSKILPEIQWQELDNDVNTSDEQKKSAIRKEVNWIGEAIKQIQNNDRFLKHNVTMYKFSQKYPNNE
jgi:hypothetical protein